MWNKSVMGSKSRPPGQGPISENGQIFLVYLETSEAQFLPQSFLIDHLCRAALKIEALSSTRDSQQLLDQDEYVLKLNIPDI